ncbi:hypothetical protein GC097_05050 [Paenibacillus sp. LMG 31457]|uniref:O-antigen ligase-related domain-containing protein n=1 Tax=Paenibacillus planticolens TaxID=2654976 RepID=A0ABX1ZH22_9BACL|nr:hypothetical protein [Paenibacillus planticolens]
MFIAADMEKAILEAIKITALLPFSILFSTLAKEQMMKVFRWLPYMGGFLVVVGIVFQMNRQNRLESTIGYANALAIFLLISLLITFLFYVRKASKSDFTLMIIQATGLMFTYSRAVWVLWLLSLIALVMFQEFRKRSIWLQIVWVHLISFIVTALLKKDVLFFWSRLKTIQPETSEFRMRLVYWKDSLSMIADNWWLGTGGGGWSVLQSKYQSEAYFVRFVHNHYLQLALDIGVFGSLLFIFIVLYFYYKSFILIKSLKPTEANSSLLWIKGILLAGTVLLLHAGFDFDFSFLLVFALLLMLIEYAIGESPCRAVIVFQPGIFTKTIVSISLAAMLLFTSWVTVGNFIQVRGQNNVAIGELQMAVKNFSRVQKMMPWAASSYYEMAKVYVLLGNKTNDRNDYLNAKNQIEHAVQLAPSEELYLALSEDIKRYFIKE